jgi:hypothetical protein
MILMYVAQGMAVPRPSCAAPRPHGWSDCALLNCYEGQRAAGSPGKSDDETNQLAELTDHAEGPHFLSVRSLTVEHTT